MSTKSIFRYLLLTISFLCLTVGCEKKTQFEKGNIPRDVAYQLALKEVSLSLDEVDIWASKEKIKANTAYSVPGIVSPGQDSWLFFIDEVPNANWGHPCQYLFVDMDGKVYKHSASMPQGDTEMDLLNVSKYTKKAQQGDIQFERGNIPRAQAYLLALREVNVSLEEVDIWASIERITANTTLTNRDGGNVSSPDLDSWFFLVDEGSNSNCEHPCQYLFVDVDGNVYKYFGNLPPDDVERELMNLSESTKKSLQDGVQFEKGNISRSIAYLLALREVNLSLKEVDIWVSNKKVEPNTVVLSMREPMMTSPGQDSWLFFIDEVPNANWGHPCQYLFVDMDGAVYKYAADMFPDNINTELLNISETTKRGFTVTPISGKSGTKSESAPRLNNHYAIIVSGGGIPSRNYTRYWNDCAEIYMTLTEQYGYDPSKVFVLMADGTDPGIDNSEGLSSNPDLDGDGIDDIDYAATNQNLDIVLNYLYSQLSYSDYLFIYTIDHGGMDYNLEESYLVMWNAERYYASTFANKVKSIRTKATHIVMGQCHSGGFVEYFTNSRNICISTACGKYELSYSTEDYQFDEFVHLWTQSHQTNLSDLNGDNLICAWESFRYAEIRDTQAETPCHYGGANYFSERLTLNGQCQGTHYSFIDGYCVFNQTYNYSFYTNSHFHEPDLHEPEFGIARGGKVDIYITQPVIPAYSFNWTITENSGYASVFSPNNDLTYVEIASQAPIGQRVRVKVEANTPDGNYYLSQFLNFYITSGYYISKNENSTLSIVREREHNSTVRSSSNTFEYQIVDSKTRAVKMRGENSNEQTVDMDISRLHNGTYTLIIRENGEIMANQRLTIP